MKGGGKPQNLLKQKPKPLGKTSQNQTRTGKPNQKGKKTLKEGGQPTIADLIKRIVNTQPEPDLLTNTEGRINQTHPTQKPTPSQQTLETKPPPTNTSEPTQGQDITKGPSSNEHLATQPQKAKPTQNTGTKPKTKPRQKPNQIIPGSRSNNKTTKKTEDVGRKQQTILEMFNTPAKPNPRNQTIGTRTICQGNQPNPKPKPESINHIDARPTPTPVNSDENQKLYSDINKPTETENYTPECEPKPEPNQTNNKPPKLKTKVVHVGDFKLYLAAKKKEREVQMKNLRGNENFAILNNPSDRSFATLHPIQPNPLPPSASGIAENYPALHRTAENGNQEYSANPDGRTNLYGNLLLAKSSKNLG